MNQIIAALAVGRWAHPVVYFRAAVDGDDDVVHLAVEKFDHLIVQIYAVGRGGKLEALMVLFLQFAPVSDDLPDRREVEQRLAAEEIHLEVVAGSRFSSPSQSSAFLPVSTGISARLRIWYSPASAKQYLQRRLQSCAAWMHMALTIPAVFTYDFQALLVRRKQIALWRSSPVQFRQGFRRLRALIVFIKRGKNFARRLPAGVRYR